MSHVRRQRQQLCEPLRRHGCIYSVPSTHFANHLSTSSFLHSGCRFPGTRHTGGSVSGLADSRWTTVFSLTRSSLAMSVLSSRNKASFMVFAHYRRPGHEHEYNNQAREVDQDVRHIASICPARLMRCGSSAAWRLILVDRCPSLPFSRHLAHRSAGVIGFGGSASAPSPSP